MIRIGRINVSGVDIDQDTLNKLNKIPEVTNSIDGEGVVTAPVIKAELEKYQTKSDMEGYAKTSDIPDVNELVNKNELANLATKDDISNFITRDDVPDVDLTTLDMYFNSDNKTFELKYKNEILSQVDVSEFVKDGMLDTARLEGTNLVIVFNTDSGKQPITIDLSKLIKAYTAGNGININDNVISANTDVLVTKSDLDRKAERSELNSIQSTVSDLESRKAERSELNSKANVSEIPDVSNFITRDDIPEIPDTSNFVTRDEIPTVPENVSAFNNDAGYLTEHQDLSEYAKSEDIPKLTNVVKYTNDLNTVSTETKTTYVLLNDTEAYKKGIYTNVSSTTITKEIKRKDTFSSDVAITSNNAIKEYIYQEKNYNTKRLYNKYVREEIDGRTYMINFFTDNKNATFADLYAVGDSIIYSDVTTISNPIAIEGKITYVQNNDIIIDDKINISYDGTWYLEGAKNEYFTDNNQPIYYNDNNYTYKDISNLSCYLIKENNRYTYIFTPNPIKTEYDILITINENHWEAIIDNQSDSSNSSEEYALKDHNHDDVYAKIGDIPNTDEFVTRGELPNFSEFATTSQLNDKADRSELPDVSNFATTSQLDNKADRSELPDWTQFVTASELNNKADRSELPSLEGYATEEYVNNAVANAGGSSNSGNYLKLVNDLDNYKFAKGEIVKYNGNTGTYINGADYQQKETTTNGILIPAGSYKANFGDRYRDLEWSERSNGLFLSTPNGYFTNISDEDYSIKILLYDSASKLFCVPSDVKVGDYAITNLTGTAISFEKVTAVGQNNSSGYPESITIYGKGVFRYNNCLKKGEGGYINGNLFVGNTSYPYLYITYVNGISHMFVAESYNNAKGSQTNEDIYLSGETIKSIELTDFCKRALNIE